MFAIACIFFRFGNFPSLETIKPKIIFENTINAHLFGFKLMPYSLHFWKHSLSFCEWFSMSLYIVKASKISSKNYPNTFRIWALWYVGGPFLTPNCITFYIKAPQSITNAILYLSSRVINIWWYHEYPFKKEYASYPAIVFNSSYVKGNGYGSFFMAAFNF